MAVTYSTAVKNARLDAVIAQIGASGTLEIMTAGSSVLATITLNSTAGTSGSGVLTFAGFPKTVTATGTGTAALAQIKAAGTPVITGLTVGTSGTDIVFTGTAVINSGQSVTISTASITSP
jgi:hypothetical protein